MTSDPKLAHLSAEALQQLRARSLSARAMLDADAHLAGCAECRAELAGIASVSDAYRLVRGITPPRVEHLALELFLAWRATGLPIETPAIRR